MQLCTRTRNHDLCLFTTQRVIIRVERARLDVALKSHGARDRALLAIPASMMVAQ